MTPPAIRLLAQVLANASVALESFPEDSEVQNNVAKKLSDVRDAINRMLEPDDEPGAVELPEVEEVSGLLLGLSERVAVCVDQENGAPEFWNAVDTREPPNEDAALLRQVDMVKPLVVTSAQAKRMLQWAVTLPEWADPAAPQFAPHPLLLLDADDVEDN